MMYSEKKLSLKEMAKICIGMEMEDPTKMCRAVPTNITYNATFVIDTRESVKNCDKTTDLIVYDGHSCPNEKVSHAVTLTIRLE